ncbi:ATP-binding protein [Polynucleobacter sp. MG-27-Goln-C1]|uniref:ATP-binding protein n=1 Tax=Polynucleobacter sp. MG-27-Goln-C1 TaxID=1819726 RepID=UPI001C0BEC30|nr:ATP-binding protein [Polynucleobacter sp. MG-27-Goln-C1]MBU3612266.1 ATP-binding protein [Polynucleobacter sp. MG-27-Goln-C1]
MFLKKISYQERALGPAGSQTWQIDDLELGQINLIVGKNSSGKSRLVNLIGNLSQLVSGKLLPRYNSGSWVVEFERMKGEAKELQLYELEVKDQLIVREQFRVGKTQIMSRARDGSGFVLNRKNTEKVKYKVPEDQLMAVVRRDEIQHPYFDQLFKWGSSLCVYRFGSDFGRNNVTAYENPYVTTDRFSMSNFSDNPAHVFKKTLERFGDEYRQLILSDLSAVGYNCSDIVLTVIPTGIVIGLPPTQLAVKEVELNCFTTQGEMSQGMFRVLALAIQINANILWAQSLMLGRSLKPGDCPMIVIDDIGEGLDFTRSKVN